MYLGELCNLLAVDIVPPVAMDMGEETWDDVMDLLDSCEVVKWNRRYQGTSVGTTGYFWWVLYKNANKIQTEVIPDFCSWVILPFIFIIEICSANYYKKRINFYKYNYKPAKYVIIIYNQEL